MFGKKNLNLPNLLTSCRIIGSLFIPFFFLNLSAFVFFIIFCLIVITDALDGFIARRLKQKTEVGQFLDPIADRVFTIMVFFTLLIAENIPSFYLTLTVTREILSFPIVVYRFFKKFRPIPNAGLFGKITTNFQVATFGVMLFKTGSLLMPIFSIGTGLLGVGAAAAYAQRAGLLNHIPLPLRIRRYF